jgi:hypothetical protein
MSHDGSWRRSTWTPPKRFKSSVISKQARRWESTGAPFNSRTRAARLPDWHSPCLSRRQLSRLIVFLPLNPEEFTTLGDCETYSALLLKCTYFAHRCAFVPISRQVSTKAAIVPVPLVQDDHNAPNLSSPPCSMLQIASSRESFRPWLRRASLKPCQNHVDPLNLQGLTIILVMIVPANTHSN